MQDTIVAIATPLGMGAIGVIRMSGPKSKDILEKVWKSKGVSVDKIVSHRLYLGNIVRLSTGRPVDKVLISYMKAPNSYTGEDIVEISCHGGTQILRKILAQTLEAGARLAEPGEFTKRAFLNGKMDLVQAEAVASIIDSKTELSAKIAEEQLEGRLSNSIEALREQLKELLVFVEATIDFPEEDISFIKRSDVEMKLGDVLIELKKLLATYDHGRIYREGVKTVIAGPPNAGKSSLLNALLGHERAIVHHIPGTTRDTIEEEALLDDVLFKFVDTAGIREAEAEVEEIGVGRSKKMLSLAEVVLLVIDGHFFEALDPRFIEELARVKHVIVVVNKKDLGVKTPQQFLQDNFPNRTAVEISAKTGAGLVDLKTTLIKEILGGSLEEMSGVVVASFRHFNLLKEAEASLLLATNSINNNESAEFIAHHLKVGLDALGKIVGAVTSDDILNEIFSNFCIGK